jgi:hypothetical protein
MLGMLKDDDFRKVLPDLDSVDPIGAIRLRARELWHAEGSPSEVDIKLLFEKARFELGSSSRQPKRQRKPLTTNRGNVAQVDPELARLADSSNDRLKTVIIEAIKERPNEHESICLARLLHMNALILSDQTRIEPQSIETIAALLADIAGDYPEDLLDELKVSDFRDLDSEVKKKFWTRMISGIFEEDEALTFSTRLTIMRYVSLLKASRLVSDVAFEG